MANSFEGNELFEYDFCEWAAAYAAGKAEDLSTRIEDAYLKGDKKQHMNCLKSLFIS